MGFQKSVTTLAKAYPGDVAGGLFYPTQGKIVRDLVTVGKFAWIDAVDSQFVSINKGTNKLLAGLVYRDNTTVWNNADYQQGYSMNVSAGYECQIATKGPYYVILFASLNAGAAVNIGDIVYSDANGNAVIGVTTQQGYTKTNFVIGETGIVGDLILITNTANVNA